MKQRRKKNAFRLNIHTYILFIKIDFERNKIKNALKIAFDIYFIIYSIFLDEM